MPTDEISGRIRLRPLGGLDTVSSEGVIDPRDTPDSGDTYNISGRVRKRPAFRRATRLFSLDVLDPWPVHSTSTTEGNNMGLDVWTHGSFLYVSGVEKLYQCNGTTGAWVKKDWGIDGTYATYETASRYARFGDHAIIPGWNSSDKSQKITSGGVISDLGGTPPKFSIAQEYNRMLFTANNPDSPSNSIRFSGIGTAEIWLSSDELNAGSTSQPPRLLAPLGDFLLVGHPMGFYRITGYGRGSMGVYPFITGLGTVYNAWATDGNGVFAYCRQPIPGYNDASGKNTACGIYYITADGSAQEMTDKISNSAMFESTTDSVRGYEGNALMMEWSKHYDSLFVIYPRYYGFSATYKDTSGQTIYVRNPAGWSKWNMDDLHRVSGICNGVLPGQVYAVGQGASDNRYVYQLNDAVATDDDGTAGGTQYFPYWTTPRLAVGTPNVNGRVTNVTVYGSQTSGGGFKLQYRKDSDTDWTTVEPTTSAEYYLAYSTGVGGWAWKTHGVNIAMPSVSCRSIELKIIWPGDSVQGELIGIDIDYVEEGVLQ